MSDTANTSTDMLPVLIKELGDKLIELSNIYGIKIIGALIMLIAGYWLAKFFSKNIEKLFMHSKGKPDKSIGSIIRKITFIAVMILVFIAVLNRFGVDTTSFIALLGTAGLAIGLALQGTLSNVAAGVMLMIIRPFKAGDAISIGGGEVYLIDEISLFVTRAHMPECPRVVIPNSKIWGDTIVNYSNTFDDIRRFDIIFSVSYDNDLDKTIGILLQLAKDDPRILAEPAPFIKVDSLGDSAVNIMFRVHASAQEWWDAKLDLTKEGKQKLEAAGISIPYPQHDVHLINETKST